jgi:hypothetical protein
VRAHSVRQEPLTCLRSRVSVNQPTGLLRQSRVASADARRLYCDNQDATSASVRRQRLWDQIGDLSNEGCLAHRNPKESEDVPEILSPLPPVRRPKSCRAIFAVLRASTITPRTRSAPSWKGLASSEALKILKSSGQRRSLSRFPFARHFPLRKHVLSLTGALKLPSICGPFARNLDGASTEWSGFFSPNRGRLSRA